MQDDLLYKKIDYNNWIIVDLLCHWLCYLGMRILIIRGISL